MKDASILISFFISLIIMTIAFWVYNNLFTKKRRCLMILDMQYDFVVPGGSLCLNNTKPIIDYMYRLTRKYRYGLYIASKCYHPIDHCSFVTYGGKWRPHCVAGTKGANLENVISEIVAERSPSIIILKGTDTFREEYSAATRQCIRSLEAHAINHVEVVGVATDVCVYYTVKDLLDKGYKVTVLLSGCRAVNEEDAKIKLQELKSLGARIVP